MVQEEPRRRESTVIRLMGLLLLWTSASMALPLAAALWLGEPVGNFLLPLVACLLVALPLSILFRGSHRLRPVEAIFVVSSSWLVVMLAGSLPYMMAGMGALDACFESLSGFTTTGASIMTDVSAWPESLLLWRSMTQWLGGAGIIMVFVTVFPLLGIGGRSLMFSEAPSMELQNLSVRIRRAAQEFHLIYMALSGALLLSLLLMGLEGMDALCITFSTISTGGFSPRAGSIGDYGAAVQWVVIAFMFLGGTSFYLHYRSIRDRRPSYLRSVEFRWVLTVAVLLSAALAAWRWSGESGLLGIEPLLRGSIFQTVSLLTSTGFVTEDFSLYPSPMLMLLLLAALVGASSGSTSGGVKSIRIIIAARYLHNGLLRMVYPRAVLPVKVDGNALSEESVNSAVLVLGSFVLVLLASALALSLLGMGASEAMASSLSALANLGPSLGEYGPYGSYAGLDPVGKVVLMLTMWAGRLEITAVLVMLSPLFWKEMRRRP